MTRPRKVLFRGNCNINFHPIYLLPQVHLGKDGHCFVKWLVPDLIRPKDNPTMKFMPVFDHRPETALRMAKLATEKQHYGSKSMFFLMEAVNQPGFVSVNVADILIGTKTRQSEYINIIPYREGAIDYLLSCQRFYDNSKVISGTVDLGSYFKILELNPFYKKRFDYASEEGLVQMTLLSITSAEHKIIVFKKGPLNDARRETLVEIGDKVIEIPRDEDDPFLKTIIVPPEIVTEVIKLSA